MRRVSDEQRDLEARAVRDLDVADVLRIVDDSGVADLLEREMKRGRGRPRAHSWRSVLALFLLGALQQETAVHLVRTQNVWWGLTPKQRELLGFDRDVSHSTIDGYLNDLLDATYESVDLRDGQVLPPRVTTPEIDLLNGLLHATVKGIKQPDTALAIDSMPVEAWARRRGNLRDTPEKKAERARRRAKGVDVPEPDPISEPGWPKPIENGKYRMTLDPDAYEVFMGSKNLQSARILVGADLHVAADASPLGQSDYPQIPRGFLLGEEDADKDETLLAMVDSMRRVGVDVTKVLIDRGYSQLTGLGLALSQRQIEQAIKLKSTQMGPHGTPIPGTVMIDGGLFVDWMPQRLWHLPNFNPGMTTEATAALAARYDERIPYAFSPKGKPDWARGVQQFRGPAASGKVSCANRPGGARVIRETACPSVAQLSAHLPAQPCACSAQPSLGPDDDLDLRQRYLYGTTKWLADYSRRSSIEASNANFTTHFSGLGDRRSIRVLKGRRKRAWLTCFGIIAVAIRLMRSRYGTSPSRIAQGEQVTEPLPKPVRKDKNGREKKTLNVQVFGRRKARRKTGRPPRGTPTSKPPNGPPSWAVAATQSAGDSVK